jgi:ABC-type multidrug transport system fused ATPase/permease subunit
MINVADIMSGWPLTNALRGYPIIATESLLTLGILCVLMYIAPYPALFSIVILGSILFLSHSAIRRHLVLLSRESAKSGGERLQFLQQSLGSVKEIKVLGREAPFVQEYADARNMDAATLTRLMVWQSIPRFLVEPLALAALTVAIIAVSYGPATNAASTTAVLGLFAVAGIRLTPSLTRILVASNSIRASSVPLERISQDLSNLAREEIGRAGPLVPVLRREIRGCKLDYRYPTGTKPVLHDLSFLIARGEAVGLMGSSGAGKTTLADVVIGLLQPDSGCILVDGIDIVGDRRGWQRQIGYIPQTVSLIDASLKENIALGVKSDQIDMARMKHVVTVAQLDVLIENAPQGLNTKIGERGARLSGGERQRIGIARALYDGRTVLVMDEATSALDSETENEIGEAIARLHGEFTILVIAHRVNTMRRCDRIMVLKDGNIIDQGTPDEIENRHMDFHSLIQHEG